MTWDAEELPYLVQWKMPEQGTYVLGLEPGNCVVKGRMYAKEQGTLVYLEPGESKRYELAFAVNAGEQAAPF